jgi:hypothetical protein
MDESVTVKTQHEIAEYEHTNQNNDQHCPFTHWFWNIVLNHPPQKTQNYNGYHQKDKSFTQTS